MAATLMHKASPYTTVCKKAPSSMARQQVINDIIWRTLSSAGIPAIKEPSGLSRQDGKRLDGLTLIPRLGGKPLVWDVTSTGSVLCRQSSNWPGAVAKMVAERKAEKYHNLSSDHIFQVIAGRIWVPSALHLWNSRAGLICVDVM